MKTILHLVSSFAWLLGHASDALSSDRGALPRIVMASIAPPPATALSGAHGHPYRGVPAPGL